MRVGTGQPRLPGSKDGVITASPLLMTLYESSRCRNNPKTKNIGDSVKAIRPGDTQDPEVTKKAK